MAINNDILELQKIGFLANDAVVYLKLIDMGTSSAGPIIASTGLHRNVVYTS
jgi:sugar-specific transcriptional regulator TrmB